MWARVRRPGLTRQRRTRPVPCMVPCPLRGLRDARPPPHRHQPPRPRPHRPTRPATGCSVACCVRKATPRLHNVGESTSSRRLPLDTPPLAFRLPERRPRGRECRHVQHRHDMTCTCTWTWTCACKACACAYAYACACAYAYAYASHRSPSHSLNLLCQALATPKHLVSRPYPNP